MIRPVSCPSCGTEFRPDVVVGSSHDASETTVVGGKSVREYARQRGMAPAIAIYTDAVGSQSGLSESIPAASCSRPCSMARQRTVPMSLQGSNGRAPHQTACRPCSMRGQCSDGHGQLGATRDACLLFARRRPRPNVGAATFGCDQDSGGKALARKPMAGQQGQCPRQRT